MTSSCNCRITGVRLQPTVLLHCLIYLCRLIRAKCGSLCTITFEKIVIVLIRKQTGRLQNAMVTLTLTMTMITFSVIVIKGSSAKFTK